MSLLTDIQAAVADGFSALDDLPVEVTYVQPDVSATYDAATDAYTGTDTETTIPKALLLSFSTKERLNSLQLSSGTPGKEIRETDRKLVFEAASVSSLTPDTSGQVVISSVTWSVVSVHQDPAGATWTLQIRKPS